MDHKLIDTSLKKAGYYIRPFCIWTVAVIVLSAMGMYLSAGLPWGIDDGVKRLTARAFAESNGGTLLVDPPQPDAIGRSFFPIQPPFMENTGDGYRSVFPALWPAFGGIFYAVFGTYGFYLVSAAAFVSLLWLTYGLTKRYNHQFSRIWILVISGSALLFYGLTFWEHSLTLAFLVPILALLISETSRPRRWFWAGISFGISVDLRPETLLLYPLLWLATGFKSKTKVNRLLLFSGGAIITVLGAMLIEMTLTGRWMASQVLVNYGLIFDGTQILNRFNDLFHLFLSSPLPLYLYGNGLLMLLLLGLVRRNAFIPAMGLPFLSVIGLIWAYAFQGTAFSITAHSQGLFFALPWIGVSFLSVPNLKRHKDPMFILGWGYILLAFLLGSDKAGMHWGPRFLFPALLPLALRCVQVLSQSGKRASGMLGFASVLAALIYASGALFAIAERGSAGRDVAQAIDASSCQVLILERWHEGADLEPLWSTCSPFRVTGEGSMEGLLLHLKIHGIAEGIGWLTGEDNLAASDFPLEILSRYPLPNKAGWHGDLLSASLAADRDERWGELYWHAGRRKAEQGLLEEARSHFQNAVDILPSNADVRYDLAICLGKMGLETQAIDALRETLRIDPSHEAARTLMGLLGRP